MRGSGVPEPSSGCGGVDIADAQLSRHELGEQGVAGGREGAVLSRGQNAGSVERLRKALELDSGRLARDWDCLADEVCFVEVNHSRCRLLALNLRERAGERLPHECIAEDSVARSK